MPDYKADQDRLMRRMEIDQKFAEKQQLADEIAEIEGDGPLGLAS
jgi:hypothetical protein